MRVRFTRGAIRQIEAVLDYVAGQSPGGAARISGRIEATVGLIATHPQAGQTTSREGVRRVVLAPYPYVIYYRVAGDDVAILRFRHTSRKPT